MFALGLDIIEKNGKTNLISTGRGLGDMGTALAAIKPAEASTINTFTKNILFTAIYINKQANGNEMFQTSLQSLLETTDQLMDLLAQNFQVYPITTSKPLMKKLPSVKSSENESSSDEETESKAERKFYRFYFF